MSSRKQFAFINKRETSDDKENIREGETYPKVRSLDVQQAKEETVGMVNGSGPSKLYVTFSESLGG